VLLTGALMAFGMAGAMSAAAGFSFSERPAGWVLKYMILPEVLLVPLWLFLEIRAGHRALSQGAKPPPLFAKRRNSLHRWSGILIIAFIVVAAVRCVVEVFVVTNDAVSPEIPRGSTVLVFKLARAFKVGDIIAYRLDKQMLVARVSTDGPHEGAVLVTRHEQLPQFSIGSSRIIGKVIFNTREGAPLIVPKQDPPSLFFKLGERQIQAFADVPVSMQSDLSNGPVMEFSGHTLRIEKTRLLLDDEKIADMSSSVSAVDVIISQSLLTVTADRVGIVKTNMQDAGRAPASGYKLVQNQPTVITETPPPKRASVEEIRNTNVQQWFDRIGNEYGTTNGPFTAMWALIQKARQGDKIRNEIIRTAIEIIDEPLQDDVKRWQCCYVLSGIDDSRGIPALKRALQDKSEVVRGVAACALGAFDDSDARSALEEAARTEKSAGVLEWIRKSFDGQFRGIKKQ